MTEDESGVSHVSIELPDTLLEIEVVDQSGDPVGGATVLVLPYPPVEKPSFDRTNEEGLLTMRGLAYSDYRVEAHFMRPEGALRSDPIVATISDTVSTASVQLMIRKTVKLRGRVVASIGTAVPGATISLMPPTVGGLQGMLIPKAQSDHAGRFEVEVPQGAQEVTATVLAPGFVLTRTVLPVDPSREYLISLSQDGGGTLIVELAELGDDPYIGGRPTVDLVHDSRDTFNAAELSNWADMNGERGQGPKTLQVPLMPVGNYLGCWKTYTEEGIDKVCEEGFLSSNGFLELSKAGKTH